ncbi:MAG: flagellar motor protein MotB [Methylobacter sp.]|nr:MAG: flagellar motor protein MotB [Methylobacter sp.]PPD03559.1 MAG: flagellar motor protein MotB [Methylobacter sp.]PPD20839.1 MAG: flagellar motor protein MotB [Methylobacter sp.]PPD36538.1 MAG: flagellar motor protein MotB [Methylomonas sp.]
MFKKHLIALSAVVGLGLAASVQAETLPDTRWYAAPFASFINTGGDRGANDGWGGGLGLGKIINEHFNVELRGFYQGYDHYVNRSNGLTGNWDVTGGNVDLQYYLFRDKFSPYAVAGLGAINTSVRGDSGVGFIGEAGAGFTYELLDNLLLRSDVRYRYNNNFGANLRSGGTNEFHDLVVNMGFVIPFGPKPTSVVEAKQEFTPPPKVADCSTKDSDHDGVSDCSDKCPGTISGSKVDFYGCPIRIELKGVHFKYNSAELTENAQTILDGVAASLIAYPQDKAIEVQGHTSSEGSDAYNLKLSQRRSQSVVSYLKQKGVNDKLYAKGYGERDPVADNSTEEGRSQNRRVELVWISE